MKARGIIGFHLVKNSRYKVVDVMEGIKDVLSGMVRTVGTNVINMVVMVVHSRVQGAKHLSLAAQMKA